MARLNTALEMDCERDGAPRSSLSLSYMILQMSEAVKGILNESLVWSRTDLGGSLCLLECFEWSDER